METNEMVELLLNKLRAAVSPYRPAHLPVIRCRRNKRWFLVPRWFVAHHEAAHAVLSVVTTDECEWVQISRKYLGGGRCANYAPDDRIEVDPVFRTTS